MRFSWNRLISLLFLTILWSFLLFDGRVSAQEKDAPSIMFLRLRVTDTTVSLVNATVRPGTLKKARSTRGREGISYEVTSTSGQVLWNGSVEDPLIRRFEYEDPDHPGQMLTKTVSLDTAEFTVRIPVFEEMEKLSLERRVLTGGSRRENYARQILGVIPIPRNEEGR